MLPRGFQYFAAHTVGEVTSFLKDHPGEAKILAGGMSLVPLMKLRLASPGYLVDINRVDGLEYIQMSEDGGTLLIGSLTRHHSLEASTLARGNVPLLAEAASCIGDPQVRNFGTIGGALAHSDPSGDWGATVVALRGEVRLAGPAGERNVQIDDFLIDTFTTALRDDELITRVSIPVPPRGSGGAYLKLERKAGDFGTVGVAAQITVAQGRDGGYCTSAGIGLAALGPKSIRATRAEEALVGRKLTQESILEASSAAAKECSPTDDPLRGSAKYKREMAGLFTGRALALAASRASRRGGRSP